MKALKICDRKALKFLKSVDKQKSYDRKTFVREKFLEFLAVFNRIMKESRDNFFYKTKVVLCQILS